MRCPKCAAALEAAHRFCTACGAPRVDAQAERFGDYEILEQLAEGGMGRLYKAMQPRLKRVVAIKTLLPGNAADPVQVTRFEREAQVTAQLKHPNIVAVYDVGRSSAGTLYIVMEYVEGQTLRQLMFSQPRLPVDEALGLFDQILLALIEAHAHGVVHRDLKPANVLITAAKDSGRLVKVLDFGIARALDETDAPRLTRVGFMVGTPGYAAPEQMFEDHDHRVDIFAAGIMLFELLTGGRPITAHDTVQLLQRVVEEDPPAPSSRAPGISPELDAVCLKAMARDPQKRFSTVVELRQALAQAMGKSPQLPQAPVEVSAPFPHGDELTTTSTLSMPAVLVGLLAAAQSQAKKLATLREMMKESFAHGDAEQLTALLRQCKTAASHEDNAAGVASVLQALKPLVVHELPQVLAWLEHEKTRSLATALLKLAGTELVPQLVERVPGKQNERAAALAAIKLLEPEPAALLKAMRDEPAKVRALLVAARSWPEDEAQAVFAQALSAPNAAVRTVALEQLNVQLATRLAVALRGRLHDPVAEHRGHARRWLLEVEDSGASAELGRILSRPGLVGPERLEVARAMAQLAGPADLAVLERWVASESDVPCVVALCEGAVNADAEQGRQLVLAAQRRLGKPGQDALKALLARLGA